MALIEVYQENKEGRRIFERYVEAVEEALWPFKIGDIYISISSGAGSNLLVIEVMTLRDHPCEIDLNLLNSEEDGFAQILRQVKTHFRGVRVAPDDHIQLGLE